MRIPRLTESWCGCFLKTGTKIISIVSVLAQVLLVILLSISCGLFNSIYSDPYDDTYIVILTILVVYLIASICGMLFSVLLVISVYTQRPNLAKPWLLMAMISIGVEVIVLILSLVTGDWTVAIITPIQIGFALYFWLVVYNFFQELRGIPLLGNDYGDVEGVQEDRLLRSYQSS